MWQWSWSRSRWRLGGFGAISLAARHPDLFAFAASFSGAVDIVGNGLVPVVIGAEASADGADPNAPFGDRAAHEIGWRAYNPVDLAANLRGVRLLLDTGNGEPGPFDRSGSPQDVIEQQVHSMNVTFDERLTQLGIRHTYDDYGPGTHSWPYWQRDLREALPPMLKAFRHPVSPPHRLTYISAAPNYRVYGWRVEIDRPQQEFSTLAGASRHGFELTGRGEGVVRTPSDCGPRSPARCGVRRRSAAHHPRRPPRQAGDRGPARRPAAHGRRLGRSLTPVP